LGSRKTDNEWFDALAGRSIPVTAETPTQKEARFVREVLIQQREALGDTTPSEAGFEKVLAEAKHRGLFEEGRSMPIVKRLFWPPLQLIRGGYAVLTHPAGVSVHVAATIVLIISLILSGQFLVGRQPEPEQSLLAQKVPPTSDQTGATRPLLEKFVNFKSLKKPAKTLSSAELGDLLLSENDIHPIVVPVDDPKTTASDWQRALAKADITHAISFEVSDQIRLSLPLTPATIELLKDRNIRVPAGNWCVLLIEAKGNTAK